MPVSDEPRANQHRSLAVLNQVLFLAAMADGLGPAPRSAVSDLPGPRLGSTNAMGTPGQDHDSGLQVEWPPGVPTRPPPAPPGTEELGHLGGEGVQTFPITPGIKGTDFGGDVFFLPT